MTKYFYLLLLFPIFLISSCCDKSADKQSPDIKQKQSVIDSPEERRNQALKVITNYSMEEWGDDILSRVAEVAGSTVSKEIRNRVKSKLDAKAILEKRISLLTESYNAPELARLAELYSSSQDKNLIKKIKLHDEKLKLLIEPIAIEVLSNVSASP